jgi:subtilase family serine protease
MHKVLHRVGVSAIALFVVGMIALPSLAATNGRATLDNSVVPWATARNLRGAASGNSKVTFMVHLNWRNEAGALAVAASVSDPHSANYRHYLTASQFISRYSPSSQSADAVVSWLKGQGFSVAALPKDRFYVKASGTVAQAEKAFGMHMSLYSAYGMTLRAPSSALSIPASLKGIVRSVVGLDDSSKLRRPDYVAERPASPLDEAPSLFRNAPPCSHYWAEKMGTQLPPAYGKTQPMAPCGSRPAQTRGAYGVTHAIEHGFDGSGQTIAIVDAWASPTIDKDVATWIRNRKLPDIDLNQHIFPPSGPPDVGWYSEETLDIESSHAMAPGATILYVGAADNGTGIDEATNWIVENHAAGIVSNSYGFAGENLPPGLIQAENAIFSAGAATGVGFYFSSGDNGDETHTLGTRSTDWPASSQWVTAVGGTSLAVGPTNNYLFETFWGTYKTTDVNDAWNPAPPGAFQYGGGGGTSKITAQPAWQVGVVPESISGYWGGENRAVPDVSLQGDPNTGFEIGLTQTDPRTGKNGYSEYRIGGTSLSCPLLAGIMALADQMAGTPHGFAAPALYALYGTDAYRDIMSPATTVAMARVDYVNGINRHNGKVASLRTTGQLDTLTSVAGYDDSTGMGSPNGQHFLDGLSS